MVRSWIRQALRASGVAILVPAAIAAAIGLSVIGGGRGVGSLGQVLAGPAVPPAEPAVPPAVQPRRDERPRQAVAVAARATPVQARPRSGVSQPKAGRPVMTLPVRRPVRPPAGAAPPPPPSSSPGTSPAPPPAPPAQPRPIHDTGTQVAETVRPLPVAGPVAADAVQAVVDLVDPPL